MNNSSMTIRPSNKCIIRLVNKTKNKPCKCSLKDVVAKLFTSWLKSIHSTFLLSIKYSLYVLIILSCVLYPTSQYYCQFSTWHQLSIYLGGDHLEVQKFNLTWSNLNKKLSIPPLTRITLDQCTIPFGIFKHVK